MPKREREVVNNASDTAAPTSKDIDPTDSALSTVTAALEPFNCGKWSSEDRAKLHRLIGTYLALDTEAYDTSNPLLPKDMAEDRTVALWPHLSKMKEELRPLVGTYKRFVAKDKDAKPPTYETTEPTFEVDAFLYDEEELDDLEERGLISRNYCTKCMGTKLAPSRLISHSFSQQQLAYIFGTLIPTYASADASKLLDVGSRLGVVPITAHVATKYSSIIGIELNKEYCNLSEQLIKSLKLPSPDRISILNIDALGEEGLKHFKEADVVVLNNVFEWYADTAKLLGIWEKIKSSGRGKAGQLLVTNPSLEDSLLPLLGSVDKVDAFLDKWVVEINTDRDGKLFTKKYMNDSMHMGLEAVGEEDLDSVEVDSMIISPLHVYRVLS